MRCINCMREWNGGGACPHCGFDAAKYKPPNDALPPGSSLNDEKYLIGRALGRGGFGITYVALDRNLGLPVAIKECLPMRGARRDASGASVQWSVPAHEQESAMENLVREARKMAKIYGIPGVVPVRGYFYDNDTAYIVMDYVEGETLAERLRRTGPLSARECFRLLSPVMDTLSQAHRLQIEGEDEIGVIHRDIKPSNIIIGRIKGGKERVWLLDLGAAKDLGTRDSAPNVSVESRPVGTPGYAPPEQGTFKGSIGPWTDVYAMSATFIYCMTGQKPPDSQSRSSEIREPEVLLSVPGPLGDVLRKGMALHREERYQTMKELRDALEKAIPKPKPKRPKWIPALVALPIIVFLVGLFFNTSSEPVIIPDIPEIGNETSENTTPSQSVNASADESNPLADTVPSEPTYVSENKSLATTIASGKCGENASWTLDADGLLTVYGIGDMQGYKDSVPPWNDYKNTIFSVYILSGITNIGDSAFSFHEKLTSVVVSDSVTAIGSCAFSGCTALINIEIPESVTTIGPLAFYDCGNLTGVNIPNNITTISQQVFYGCKSLSSISIPNSVTMIDSYAFYGCSRLETITIPNSVMIINNSAFAVCSNLEAVTIPNSVTIISSGAFSGCSNLTNIIIPNSVTTIDRATFAGCSNLVNIIIPNSVTTIKSSAFARCDNLTSIKIPDSVAIIGAQAFSGCSNLTSITIPDGITEIDEYTFRDCGSLTRIVIPDSVTEIYWGAFSGCTSLESVSVPEGANVADDAFDANTTVTRR